MKYLSTFSGIEAATVAWHPLGWEPVGFSEIEPFPCAVLKHHYPNVQNYGDITKYRDWSVEPFQLLVGGSPCQSFSVAGLRKGLADERGNLMLEFGRLAEHYRPTWVVWENVPGVLSSNGGRDFASFLGMLAEFGYGFAYRILDAQYFGVPQRRRRVFVVGYLGDWRPAAAVLFDPHSLSGHPPPSREAGQGTPGGVKAGSHWSGGPHPSLSQSLKSYGGIGMSNQEIFSQGVAGLVGGYSPELSNALCARDYKGPRPEADQGAPVVVQPLAFKVRGGCEGGGKGYLGSEDCAFTLSTGVDQHIAQPVTYDMQQVTAPVLQPIGVDLYSQCITGDVFQTVSTRINASTTGAIMQQMTVRRLLPTECEALQGFPRGYTAIPWKNKPAEQCPDGPRYKALGNSMAVPVMQWIGERIQAIDNMLKELGR